MENHKVAETSPYEMKYMAKHPVEAAYELSREELKSSRVVEQLRINQSWIVNVGGEWIPLLEFLGMSGNELHAKPTTDYSMADALLAPRAQWTPGSIFSLVLRLLGVFLLFEVFRGGVSLVSGIVATSEPPVHVPWPLSWASVITLGCYLAAGFYLVLGSRALVAWVFSKGDQSK
jgi:hypothetical protein